MSSPIARQVLQAFREMGKRKRLSDDLTPRERDVVEKLAQGLQYQEIANDLFLSVDTVRSHIHKIYKKLQVNSRKALLEQYEEWR
jgi:DNA-binding NarL/FixJ family response regulator